MTTALDIRPQMSLCQSTYLQLLETPSLCVPSIVRPHLFSMWARYRHLTGLDTAFPLATALSDMIELEGLHEDDAITICREMRLSKYASKHKFASDVTASMGELAEQLTAKRKDDERRLRMYQERKERQIPDAIDPQTQADMKAMIEKMKAGIGTPVIDKPR